MEKNIASAHISSSAKSEKNAKKIKPQRSHGGGLRFEGTGGGGYEGVEGAEGVQKKRNKLFIQSQR